MAWANPPLTLFHGTVLIAAQSIVASGIDRRTFRPGTDFGPGFYATTNLAQAQEWAARKAGKLGGAPAVISFLVDRDAAASLQAVWFVRHGPDDSDFWALVGSCRDGAVDHGRTGPKGFYDLVVGPVAKRWTSRPYLIVDDSDQVSFHSDNALAILREATILA
jgi:hypothetical protein